MATDCQHTASNCQYRYRISAHHSCSDRSQYPCGRNGDCRRRGTEHDPACNTNRHPSRYGNTNRHCLTDRNYHTESNRHVWPT